MCLWEIDFQNEFIQNNNQENLKTGDKKLKKVKESDSMTMKTFYIHTLRLLELSIDGSDSYLYFNNNLNVTYDNKQMILPDDRYLDNVIYENLIIKFHPFNEREESCSHLLINDSIHFYLKNLTYNLFNKIITTKDGTSNKKYPNLKFDKLASLPNPTKNTMSKFNNLFNIVTATSFSKNLISFSIDLITLPHNGTVAFQYPLYDELFRMNNNTIFGIYLEDVEIKLFKRIYENYLIKTIDNLFEEVIRIPQSSSMYPRFYIHMKMLLKLQETFWEEYNKEFFHIVKDKFIDYNEMLNNLTQFENRMPSLSEQQQHFDHQCYKNELEIRKSSESNWLKLKDNNMNKNTKNQQLAIVDEKNISVEALIQKINSKSYTNYFTKLNDFLTKESVDNFKQNYQLNKNNQEFAEIFYWQSLVLKILKENNGSLWFDTRIKKYCFRSKLDGKIVEENKEGISELLSRALKEKITNHIHSNHAFSFPAYAIEIVLVDKFKSISNQKLKDSEKASNVIKIFLFEHEIPTVDDDEFDTQTLDEFIENDNLMHTRNRFIPTKYLQRRNNTLYLSPNRPYYNDFFELNEKSYLWKKVDLKPEQETYLREKSFIADFIFYLVNEDIHIYCYVMNWLSCFYNNLQKSGTVLVLLGNQEVTQGIFWDKIIKEIFGIQYCTTINDNECKSSSSFDIAKEKLFFHIGDIINAGTKFDDETLYKLIKDLLVKSTITEINQNNDVEEVFIYGQIIVTAKNPSPHIKKAMSKCTIIKVNDIDTIIDKLGVPDELILEDKIHNDLENFAETLQTFNWDLKLSKYAMDTKDRETVISNKSSNIVKEDINNDINAFIQAIKDKNINYFEKLKDVEDGIIYKRLKNAFSTDDGYFIGQDLLLYYNATHQLPFKLKKQLTDKLKEKDEMFAQEVKVIKILRADKTEETIFQAYKTSKETDNKELYKINNYTMAKDITIPNGATVISSQDNIRKYNLGNPEEAIKLHKEYHENKQKDKN